MLRVVLASVLASSALACLVPLALMDTRSTQAQSAQRVILAESFDDEETGWLRSAAPAGATYQVGYVDGEYRMQVPPGVVSSGLTSVPGTYTNTGISLDARIVNETENRWFTIACRASSGENGGNNYQVAFSPDARLFRLVKIADGAPTVLVDWRPTIALQRGNASNRVGLFCIGDLISVMVNGTEVVSVQDSAHQRGFHWISVGSSGMLGVDARFDNLEIVE